MDDLQLNISTRQPAKTKKDPKKSHDFKFVKTNLTGKTIARKRPVHQKEQSQKQNEEPQKKVQKLSTPANQNNTKDLATSLRDLSENKGKFKGKNYQDITDDLQINRKPRPGGWISSLFKNNPDVPRVGQRAVKPIVEKLFTGCNLSDLNLHPHSVANLQQNVGLKEFMSVQQKSIPIILQGRDVLIRSQTGSGKTLAYALPIIEGLQAIRPKINRHDGIRVVVVLPTRELAVQTYELFVKLVKPFTWVVPGLLSGGQKRKAEKARLRKGLNILVGTPGRINDHLRHTKSLNFALTRCLVLDEADCLLDMGYEKDVAAIVKALEDHKKAATYDPMALVKQSINKKISSDNEDEEPAKEIETEQQTDIKHNLTHVFLSKERQTILLSATLTKAVESLAGITMVDPVFVDTSEGRAVIADSLKPNLVKDVKQNSKSSIAEESPKPSVVAIEKIEAKTVHSGGETRGGLKQFSGLNHPDLFSNENTQPPKQTITTTTADDSDSDSDYEYYKVQKELENKTEVVDSENDEAAPEINKFDLALKTALTEDELILPASVNQTFLVIPMKLRLVTLCSLIVEHCVLNKKGKIIVFMATLDMVDYHADLIETVLCGNTVKTHSKKSKTKVKKKSGEDEDGDDDEDGSSDASSDMKVDMDEFSGAAGALVPVDLEIFSLHGSMPHERRIEVFKQFRKAKSGVLICSDVAARGIDVPRVDLVLQYCVPASATNYVHRVGRTGRAAQVGAAIMFLLPSEVEYVRYLEQKRIRLKQASESNVLEGLRRVAPSAANAQRAAIQVQTKLEQVAHSNKDWLQRASRAYTSWVRFYSGYPHEVRPFLRTQSLHLGHSAKAFALRDTPTNLARRARNDTHSTDDKPNNRLTVRDEEQKKRPGFDRMKLGGGGHHMKIVNKQSSMHTASEYDSGLPPITATKKQKKHK